MPARVVSDVTKLVAGLKGVTKEAKEASKYMARMKGGGSPGSRRNIVVTDTRTVRGPYYDETSRALGL